MSQSEALLRLQQIDLEILRHGRSVESLPQLERIKQVKVAAKKLVSELNKIKLECKDIEIELDDNANDYQAAVSEVESVQEAAAREATDPRAARDFANRLSELAKRMERLEFQRGPLEERLAKLKESELNAQKVGMRLQAEAKSQYEAYERSSAEIRAESEKLERERRLILDELDPDVLGCYESARKRFGGIAVESLVGNKPTVCRVALQPSSYSDLRRLGKTIAECPYCHRMLVIQPAED